VEDDEAADRVVERAEEEGQQHHRLHDQDVDRVLLDRDVLEQEALQPDEQAEVDDVLDRRCRAVDQHDALLHAHVDRGSGSRCHRGGYPVLSRPRGHENSRPFGRRQSYPTQWARRFHGRGGS
jgi:hypothetical protein